MDMDMDDRAFHLSRLVEGMNKPTWNKVKRMVDFMFEEKSNELTLDTSDEIYDRFKGKLDSEAMQL